MKVNAGIAGVMSVLLWGGAGASAQTGPDEEADTAAKAAAVSIFEAHQKALLDGDLTTFQSTLSTQIMMFNCAGDDMSEWRPHLFLNGADVNAWATFFITQAGPHEGELDITQVSLQGGLALISARGDGQNRVRSWQDEESAWLLGLTPAGWRIAGICLTADEAS